MRKVVFILSFVLILIGLYSYFSKGEYYIPKPKALIKINLPDNNSELYSDNKLSFRYSKSANVSTKQNTYSVNFPDYQSRIYFNINNLTDLDLEIYNFENSISVHENKGAYINANIIEDTSASVYGVLCYLEGNNIVVNTSEKKPLNKKDLGKNLIDGTLHLSCWMTTAQIRKLQGKKAFFRQFEEK